MWAKYKSALGPLIVSVILIIISSLLITVFEQGVSMVPMLGLTFASMFGIWGLYTFYDIYNGDNTR